MPGGSRKLFHRHHRGAEHQREQKDAALQGIRQQAPLRLAQRCCREQGDPDRDADERERICHFRKTGVDDDIGGDGCDKNEGNHADARPVDAGIRRGIFLDRGVGRLLFGGDDAECEQRHDGGDVGIHHVEWADAVDPHHRGGGVAHHRAGAACVGCRDDGCQVADMHTTLEYAGGDRAANQRGSNVVEEGRQNEHHHQQHETALPVVREKARQHLGHMTVFEVPGQYRETEQQAEQIGNDHPFMRQVAGQPVQAGDTVKPGEAELVQDDGGKAGQRDLERVVVEQSDAEQGGGEQDEFDRDAENLQAIGGVSGQSREQAGDGPKPGCCLHGIPFELFDESDGNAGQVQHLVGDGTHQQIADHAESTAAHDDLAAAELLGEANDAGRDITLQGVGDEVDSGLREDFPGRGERGFRPFLLHFREFLRLDRAPDHPVVA